MGVWWGTSGEEMSPDEGKLYAKSQKPVTGRHV